MRGPGILVLLKLLLILAVLCSTGFSLNCYSCLNPVPQCKTNVTCSVNLDACLFVESGNQVYQQCWRLDDCDFKFISTRLGLSSLKYSCCQKNFCNDKLQGSGAAPSPQKVLLLTTLVLASAWNLCL